MKEAQRYLLRHLPSVRTRLTLVVVAGLAAAVLLVVQALLLSWIVRDVLFRHETLSQIEPLFVVAVCVAIGRAACITLRESAARRAAIGLKRELRGRLAGQLLALGPAYTTGERTGELVAAATDGIEKLDPYVSRYLPQTVLGIAVPFLIALSILPVDPLSTGLLAFTVPVIILLMVLIGTFTRDHVRRQWETLGRLSSRFLDILQGLPTLVLLDRDSQERSRVETLSEQFSDHTLSVLKVAFLSGAVLELMTAAGIGLIATVLGVRLLDGSIPFDRAFFVFLLTPEFYRPLRELGTHRHAALEGSAAAERILQVLQAPTLDTPLPSRRRRETARLGDSALTVDFTGVTHLYPQRRRPALTHLSLSLPAGTCTALVGRSGAGKTTVVNLLLRAMDPSEGVITVNGCPLPAIPIDVWREHIALVPQHPYLFAGTVRDNIRLARPAAGEGEVMRAAELAGCMPFIAGLPDGLETRLEERGEQLSAGERQRLALARAFLKDAPLLICDEPTSALDPATEAQIRRSLALLMQGRTVLIVAHRMNTVRAAGRIAVLENGSLVELGSHEELLRREGIYASLLGHRRQEVVA